MRRLVRIIPQNEYYVSLLQQSSGGEGIWKDFQFTLDPVDTCDYVLLLSYAPQEAKLRCPRKNVWAIMHEPPAPEFKRLPSGTERLHRVYTTDPELRARQYVHSQPVLMWMVKRNYDYLAQCAAPAKERSLSWVTSNKAWMHGHRLRLRFLERMRGKIEFDLFGEGFAHIDDKWDGLAPYRYSMAIENFSNPFYWSEKLIDCYLAWTMPIYYGCTRITDYFPAESMIQLDIHDPLAVEKIREAVASDRWKRNQDAIAHARKLVLDKYQFFPFMVGEFEAHEAREGRPPPENLVLPRQSDYRMTAASVLRYWLLRKSQRFLRILGKLPNILRWAR
jgi:hypothetical protein